MQLHYDVIGDVHGHAEKLEGLLRALGYTPEGRGYKPPSGRQAIFAGDLIDRGPAQMRVLEIVRAMVEAGHARAVLGNHEFNAIGFRAGLRPDNKRMRDQHKEFLEQVGEGSAEHLAWLAWFRTLPLALDLGGIRVAHAWWDDAAVALINENYWDLSTQTMSDGFLEGSYVADSALEQARKLITTGNEWKIPLTQRSPADAPRFRNTRVAVWRHAATRLREIALAYEGEEHEVPDIVIPEDLRLVHFDGAPVFVGHYWLRGTPMIETPRFACLDWSIGNGGPVVAYRWQGEAELSNAGLVVFGKD